MFALGIFKSPHVRTSSTDNAPNEPTSASTATPREIKHEETESLNPVYRFQKALAQGGCAEVYQGTMNSDIVAIKKPYSKSDVHLWAEEIKIHRDLDHPNIVRFIQHDTSHNYLILEYVNGQDLLETLCNNQGISWDNKKTILNGILNGLACLHKHHIVHRDIKPENVLIEWNYDTSTVKQVKLCDFGFAIQLKEEFEIRDTCVGTPTYIPPEVLVDGRYSHQSDIYAHGLIAYSLATLRFAFSPDLTLEQLMSIKIDTDLVKELRAVATNKKLNIPEGWVDLIGQSSNPDYTKRSSAQELLNLPFFAEKKHPHAPSLLHEKTHLSACNP